MEDLRCVSIDAGTSLSATVLHSASTFFFLFALVSPLQCPLLMKPFKVQPVATASADRALWKCQCPYPRGLPANVPKATIKIIQQCWVPRGIGENSLSLVPQPAQHMPRVSQSLLFRQLLALVLTPFLTRTQNQPKMPNRCHPIAQHELWFQ